MRLFFSKDKNNMKIIYGSRNNEKESNGEKYTNDNFDNRKCIDAVKLDTPRIL